MKTPAPIDKDKQRREMAELIKGMSEADLRSLLAIAQVLLEGERKAVQS